MVVGAGCYGTDLAEASSVHLFPIALLTGVLERVQPGWGPSIAKTLFWPGREWFSDMISLLDGSPWGIPVRRNLLSLAKGIDLSPLLGVVEAVGVRLRVQRPSA